eukprot:TRINITY_DN1649_c0_g1_i1.p1 TRINITY_DN1649_c0_g1~~TRINITY_DN1649_c0_g1_i1.p1  ORF type:complete len:172 (-),score=12.87 TRINITY_DN1649_c0_g1_i1:123-638(-)
MSYSYRPVVYPVVTTHRDPTGPQLEMIRQTLEELAEGQDRLEYEISRSRGRVPNRRYDTYGGRTFSPRRSAHPDDRYNLLASEYNSLVDELRQMRTRSPQGYGSGFYDRDHDGIDDRLEARGGYGSPRPYDTYRNSSYPGDRDPIFHQDILGPLGSPERDTYTRIASSMTR